MASMFEYTTTITSIVVGCDWTTAATNTSMFLKSKISDVTKVCN